jgi:class 3 adenylate cyclase
VYGAYLAVLLVTGPILELEPLATSLWLVPLALAALFGTWLLPETVPARWTLFALDAVTLTASAALRGGVTDPALLFWFPVLVLQAGRPDRRALVACVGTAAVLVLGLALRAGTFGAALVASLGATATLLWLNVRRKRVLHERLDERAREFDHLSSTFSRYFSPQVADLLAAQGQAALATGRRELSVLFADLSGFTRFTELSSAELVVGTLDEYLDELCRVALQHDGTLDKFMGDEVMVVWNAPTDQPDHARRALACARDMMLVTQLLNAERGLRGAPVLGLSIGVNTGEAIVGHIGGQNRVQYTVIGDTVNVAKRLQSMASTGEIVAGLSTVRGAGETPPVTEELTLKGRSGTVSAVRMGARSDRTAA